MPAKSQAQRAYVFQKFGKKWAEKHHFDNPGKLPPKIKPKAESGKQKGKGK